MSKRKKILKSISEDASVVLGRCIKLGTGIDDIDYESPKPVWVQVAREGDYPGYAGGKEPFQFTVEHFEQMITNLRSHPSFKAGDDGVGTENIIPWDFNHASELYPASGMLSVHGAPAQGWTRDFKLAKDNNDKTCLMALTLFLEPALTYVREGRYAWASVAALFDFVHPETADNVGAIISSIALTNTPFIEGMQRLAASKQAALRRYYGRADDPNDAFSMLKQIFGLPEMSIIDDVLTEITKLKGWIESGDIPQGIEVTDILASMREILGLPVLSTEVEVLDNALSIAATLVEQTTTTSDTSTTVGVKELDQISDLVEPATPLANRKEADMELLKKLAERLRVRESDDAVVSAIEELVALRNGIMKALDVEKDSNESILNSTTDVVQASASLKALITALGVEDVPSATERVVTLTERAAELDEIKPKYDELLKTSEQVEQEKIESDVAQVMSTMKYDDNLKEALLLYRKTDPDGFGKKYPKDTKAKDIPDRHPLLTKVVAASPTGSENRVDGSGNIFPGSATIDLARYPGRNTTERAVNCVKSIIPESKNWVYEELFAYAVNLKDQSNVVDSTASN